MAGICQLVMNGRQEDEVKAKTHLLWGISLDEMQKNEVFVGKVNCSHSN